MALDLIPRLQCYLFPLVLLVVGFASAIVTILEVALIERRPSHILSLNKWQGRAFDRTWTLMGPALTKAVESDIKAVASQAYGVVVDIGPGKGLTLKYLDRSKITKVYGVEPNTAMHPSLRAEIEKLKLGDIYTIVPYGIEQFPNDQIPAGSIDSIACIRTLCSIPNPNQTIKKLYQLLKPGGQLLVFEHCAVPDNKITSPEAILQGLYSIPWPFLLGGCELNRKTDEWLKAAGEWGRIELEGRNGALRYDLAPEVMGKLVKAG